jgi:hypothetical protein
MLICTCDALQADVSCGNSEGSFAFADTIGAT